MADIPNRDELEGKLARILGKLTRAQMGRLLEELGDPPKLEAVSSEFWDEAGKEMRDALRPFMADVYLESARRLMESQTIGVDWTGINEAAQNWASRYTYDLVTGINDTSRRRLQSAVSRYYQADQTIGDLERDLSNTFGPVRATLIAITEITRASTEGERGLVRGLEAQGLQMQAIWQTNNDDRVCVLCSERHGKPILDGIYPPRHISCRCWTNHEPILTGVP